MDINRIEVWRDGNDIVGRVSIKAVDGLCWWDESCYVHPFLWNALQEDVIPYFYKFVLVRRFYSGLMEG